MRIRPLMLLIVLLGSGFVAWGQENRSDVDAAVKRLRTERTRLTQLESKYNKIDDAHARKRQVSLASAELVSRISRLEKSRFTRGNPNERVKIFDQEKAIKVRLEEVNKEHRIAIKQVKGLVAEYNAFSSTFPGDSHVEKVGNQVRRIDDLTLQVERLKVLSRASH